MRCERSRTRTASRVGASISPVQNLSTCRNTLPTEYRHFFDLTRDVEKHATNVIAHFSF